MKALAISSPEAPRPIWVEVDEPIIRAGQVRIRTHAAGLDVRWARGMGGLHALSPDGPYLLGEIATGVVLEVGGECCGLSEGQTVFVLANGCCSKHIVAPVDCVYSLPEGSDPVRIAAISEYLLAQSILTDALPDIAEPTLWVASLTQGLGQALAFLAPPNVTLLSGAAADEKGRADLVVDCDAGLRFKDRLALLADFGRILICGRHDGDPPDFFDTLWNGLDRCPELQVWTLQRYATDRERFSRILNNVLDALGNRGWPVEVKVTPLASAPDSCSDARKGEPGAGIVFAFPESE